MFNSKSKYLFLLPIIIMIAFSAFFSRVITEINSELLHEKMIEKRLSIDLIDSQIDKFIEQDADWQEYDYMSIIADSMQNIDSIPLTFAALYDGELNNISERSPSYASASFDPMTYDEFIHAVYQNERGDLILPYAPPESEERDMLVYFRWVPTDISLENRLLTVVAISHYSITTQFADWITYGSVALIVITTLLNLLLVAFLCYLGHIHSMRHGKIKWRRQ